MAKLTTKARNALPSSAFVFPKTRKFPIQDASHARNALSRAGAKGGSTEAKVKSKVHREYPNIGKKQFGGTVTPKGGGSMTPRLPKPPALMGAPKPMRPKALTPRVPGRLSSTAGMKKGGVVAGVHATKMKSFPKPHTYRHGGVVR